MKNSLITNKSVRNSSLELLRIISMIMIVVSHYSVHGQIKTDGMELTINRLIIDTSNFGHLGVAIFVMISGYFMCEKKFEIKRVLNLMLSTLFYSVILNIAFYFINGTDLGIKDIIKTVFPILGYQYWFVTVFVIMMFISPFVNKLICNLSRLEFAVMIIALVTLFSLINTLTFSFFDLANCGSHICRFVIYYCIGAYIKIYPNNMFSRSNRPQLLLISAFLVLEASVVIMDVLGTRIGFFENRRTFFYQNVSALVTFLAMMFLIVFTKIKPFYNRFINVVGACTFGVYLIHDNANVRAWLWGTVFNNSDYADSSFLIVHYIISVAIVFVCCTAIEYLRKYVLEKYIFKKFIQRIYEITDDLVYKAKEAINKLINA